MELGGYASGKVSVAERYPWRETVDLGSKVGSSEGLIFPDQPPPINNLASEFGSSYDMLSKEPAEYQSLPDQPPQENDQLEQDMLLMQDIEEEMDTSYYPYSSSYYGE